MKYTLIALGICLLPSVLSKAQTTTPAPTETTPIFAVPASVTEAMRKREKIVGQLQEIDAGMDQALRDAFFLNNRRAWLCGYRFTEDFKFIVPKPCPEYRSFPYGGTVTPATSSIQPTGNEHAQ